MLIDTGEMLSFVDVDRMVEEMTDKDEYDDDSNYEEDERPFRE
jgi:hypothetical protein